MNYTITNLSAYEMPKAIEDKLKDTWPTEKITTTSVS